MTATLSVLLNWGALAAVLGVALTPAPIWMEFLAPAFLALMLLVVAPYRLYRQLDQRRIRDVQEVWDKNDDLRKELASTRRQLESARTDGPEGPRLQLLVKVFRVDVGRLLCEFQVANSGSPSSISDWGISWEVAGRMVRLEIEEHATTQVIDVGGSEKVLRPEDRIERQTVRAIENGGTRVGWMIVRSDELSDTLLSEESGRLLVTNYATVADLHQRPHGRFKYRPGAPDRWWLPDSI